MRQYFYKLLARYLALYIRPEDRMVDLDSPTGELVRYFPRGEAADTAQSEYNNSLLDADYVVLNGSLHYMRDIQSYLESLHDRMSQDSRLIVTYYSSLWKPILGIATSFGLRKKTLEPNWLAHEDIVNLLRVADFEPIKQDARILLPIYIPLLSTLCNRYLAPLPPFRWFAMANILLARRLPQVDSEAPVPSVSVIVAARNEAGNIENIIRRVPKMGPHDELIFVEGGSTDGTWQKIQEAQRSHADKHDILTAQQDGKGKGDAVRKGFGIASKDILMILDADLTVPPEDLPKFYRAIASEKGEFINGSRLVYPMEKQAMRFFNLLGNKFFAQAFSFVLGQRFKDTLCGTKVLTRRNYERIAAHRSYFGDFDPFGDFDLIFGAARMGLKIVEIPVSYRERTYGSTNISRWSHGALLLRMLVFCSARFKFL